jgi:archaellum biogenesis ATPase FlaH
MSARDLKDLRKQLRNVTKEILPEVLQAELVNNIKENLDKYIKLELEQLKQDVISTMARIEERSKDVQTFILNHVQSEMAKNVTTPVNQENPASNVLTTETNA